MKLLLDTHTVVWWWLDDPRLPAAARRGFEIPSGGEELLARAGDDGDAQRLVVAELDEYLVQASTGREIDGVGLGPVDRDLEYAAVGDGLDSI